MAPMGSFLVEPDAVRGWVRNFLMFSTEAITFLDTCGRCGCNVKDVGGGTTNASRLSLM